MLKHDYFRYLFAFLPVFLLFMIYLLGTFDKFIVKFHLRCLIINFNFFHSISNSNFIKNYLYEFVKTVVYLKFFYLGILKTKILIKLNYLSIIFEFLYLKFSFNQ